MYAIVTAAPGCCGETDTIRRTYRAGETARASKREAIHLLDGTGDGDWDWASGDRIIGIDQTWWRGSIVGPRNIRVPAR